MAIEMTPKEFKQFQKIEHKRKVEADSAEFAVPGLAKTILAMERRIAKLEKQLKTVEAQSRKTYAKMIGG